MLKSLGNNVQIKNVWNNVLRYWMSLACFKAIVPKWIETFFLPKVGLGSHISYRNSENKSSSKLRFKKVIHSSENKLSVA